MMQLWTFISVFSLLSTVTSAKPTDTSVQKPHGQMLRDDLQASPHSAQPDDFELVDKDPEQKALKTSLQDEDTLANQEILRLKAVEIKKQAYEQKKRQELEKLRQEMLKQDLAREAREEQEFKNDMGDELKASPLPSNWESTWNGLEDSP